MATDVVAFPAVPQGIEIPTSLKDLKDPRITMEKTILQCSGVSFIKLCVGSLLKMCVRPEAKFCVRQKIFRFIKHCVRTPVRNLCFINHILTIIVRS